MRIFWIALLLAAGPVGTRKAIAQATASKTFVRSEAEDATSKFDYIYFVGKSGSINRVIYVWNGGCCQKPEIEEYRPQGKQFLHFKSYTLYGEPENIPKAILCGLTPKTIPVAVRKSAPRKLPATEVKSGLAEALPFNDCKIRSVPQDEGVSCCNAK